MSGCAACAKPTAPRLTVADLRAALSARPRYARFLAFADDVAPADTLPGRIVGGVVEVEAGVPERAVAAEAWDTAAATARRVGDRGDFVCGLYVGAEGDESRVFVVEHATDSGGRRWIVCRDGLVRFVKESLYVPRVVEPERFTTPDEQRRDDLLIAIEAVCGESPSEPERDKNGTWCSRVTLDGTQLLGHGPNEVACAAWLLHHVAAHIARKASRT